jgi:hypothetical protein
MEVSDAWHRRAKPAFATVARYIEGLYDVTDDTPSTAMHSTTKGNGTRLGDTTSVPGPDAVREEQRTTGRLLTSAPVFSYIYI